MSYKRLVLIELIKHDASSKVAAVSLSMWQTVSTSIVPGVLPSVMRLWLYVVLVRQMHSESITIKKKHDKS